MEIFRSWKTHVEASEAYARGSFQVNSNISVNFQEQWIGEGCKAPYPPILEGDMLP